MQPAPHPGNSFQDFGSVQILQLESAENLSSTRLLSGQTGGNDSSLPPLRSYTERRASTLESRLVQWHRTGLFAKTLYLLRSPLQLLHPSGFQFPAGF